jgi:lambda family phage minor tail protein L
MALNSKISVEVQKLEPSAVIELFVLDLSELGGDVYYFHAGTNEVSEDITWQGQVYTRYPILLEGFEISGTGQLPRPKARVSNALGSITSLLLVYNDLLGAKLTRKRTLKKYLDAVNFDGGVNPDEDDTAEYPDDVYFVDRKISENKEAVEFELAASLDVAGVLLPRRQIIQNTCIWKYRSAECSYTGTNYFDINDNAVGTLALDRCGKKLSSCRVRFGENDEIPFGSFPAAGLIR